MQQEYFLGYSSPEGFQTAFWSEQQDAYGIYLKGGPGTGKSTLLKRLAAAFPEEPCTRYHCASDPNSLDAVVWEARGVFVADATAPHERGNALPYITGELVDLGALLERNLPAERQCCMRADSEESARCHQQCRQGIRVWSELEGMLLTVGEGALLEGKLDAYAERLARRILPCHRHTECPGTHRRRQHTAWTAHGFVTYLSADYSVIQIDDSCGAAAQGLLERLLCYVLAWGYDCETTTAWTRKPSVPIDLVIPACKLAIVTKGYWCPDRMPTVTIKMQRFYDAARLKAQKTLCRFCQQTIATVQEKIAECLAAASAAHHRVEAGYRDCIHPERLDQTADALIALIASFPKKA